MIVMHSLRDYDAEKSAGRMAVQAAAGALMSVTGHTCEDIVMCSTSREWDDMLEVSSIATPQGYLSSASDNCLTMASFQFGGYTAMQNHRVHLGNCIGCYIVPKVPKQ